jgi:putative hydrolase of the HAD superfamily
VDRQTTPQALLLDCLGTLVRLEAPAPRLREQLRARLGLEVTENVAATAMRAEIAHYRAHMHGAGDAASLARLRRECAAVVREAVGAGVAPLEKVEAALLAALHFTPFDDAVPALAALRARGVRLVVVSNWDVSLHDVLAGTGLDVLLDGAISSAEAGSAKPDPGIVVRALALAGVRAQDAWLVGDTPADDVGAARAAGVRPVLIDRSGGQAVAAQPGVRVIRALSELPGLFERCS